MKILTINPGKRTSLQYHNYRNEVMFYGGDNISYHFAGQDHRISNATDKKMVVVEVSIPIDGEKISESDIVRLEDDYGRVKK